MACWAQLVMRKIELSYVNLDAYSVFLRDVPGYFNR